MNLDEFAKHLRGRSLTLAFDTNAIESDDRFTGVCNRLIQYNLRRAMADRAPIRLVICAVAHFEKLFHLKQHLKHKFNVSVVVQMLKTKGVEIQPFDVEHALHTANRIGSQHKTSADWQNAKREMYLQSLGFPLSTQTIGTGKNCGATIDWLIGGHAQAENAILVTDDEGPEYRGIVDRVKLEVVEAAINELLAEHP